jgi:PHP family Zn ribbon phosphoesterase
VDVLLIAALGALVLYIGACAFWPFAACRRCSGSGKLRSPSGKAWRSCPRCGGSGKRVRVGRRIFESLNGRDD